MGRIELHYEASIQRLSDRFIADHDFVHNAFKTIYIVRDGRRAEALRSKYFLQKSFEIATHVPFISERQFFRSLITSLNIPAITLDYSDKMILLQEAIQKIRPQLSFFKFPGRQFPENILHSVLIFFDKFRLDRFDDTLFHDTQPQLNLSSSDRLKSDLSVLFKTYCQLLGPGVLDEAETLKILLTRISRKLLEEHWPDIKNIVWEDVSHFESGHLQLIQLFKDQGLDIFLLLPYARNREIFGHKYKLFSTLKRISNRVHCYQKYDKLSETLFQFNKKRISFENKVSIFQSLDRLNEIESLAQSIKKRVLDEKIRFSEVGVTSPNLSRYLNLLQTTFRKYHIPFSIFTANPLNYSPVIQHIQLLFRLILEDFSRDILQNILQSPFFAYGKELKNVPYKNILANLRVASGQETLIKFLKKAQAFYSEAEEEISKNIQQMEYYKKIIKVIENLSDELSFFKHPRTTGEIFKYFVELINRHRIVHHILKDENGKTTTIAEENITALQTLLQQLSKWHVLNQLAGNDRKYTLEEFWEIFCLIVKTQSYHLKRQRNFGVQILLLNDIYLHEFKYLYVLGMEDGVFPSTSPLVFAQPEFLPNSLRTYLDSDQLNRERELFLQILYSPSQEIRFSYPFYHQDRPILPSIFLRELERISENNLFEQRKQSLLNMDSILAKVNSVPVNSDGVQDLWKKLPKEVRNRLTPDKIRLYSHRKKAAKKRVDHQDSSSWNGILTEDPLCKAWLNNKYSKSSFSATQLEDFAFCPLFYFFKRILNMEPTEIAEEFLTPLDRGLMVHQTLFRFYKENVPQERCQKILLDIANNEFEKIPIPRSLLWQIEREFYLGSPEQKGLFGAFWEYEQEISKAYATQPSHFEFSFGNPRQKEQDTDPASVEHPFRWQINSKNYFLKGKIDRIEISNEGALLVVDYKTGNLPTMNEMWEGRKLQLPLYLKAAFDFLREKYRQDLFMAGGCFYSIRSVHQIEKKIVFLDKYQKIADVKLNKNALFPNDKYSNEDAPITLEDFVERCLSFAARYIDSIREGKFPPTDDKKNCRNSQGGFCPYLPLCRINLRHFNSGFFKF